MYRINVTKPNLNYKSDRTVVSFWEHRMFFHQPNESSLPLNTTITTLNLPLITIYKMIDSPKISPIVKFLARVILKKFKTEPFFINASIDELLFKGKYSQLLCLINKISPTLSPDCMFSFMKDQNDTSQGPFVVYTGLKDINRISTLLSYNGSSKLNFWTGDQCNDIYMANNGELFAPAGKFGSIKRYKFFRPDFCRAFNLTLEEANIVSDVEGLRTDRFRLDKRSFFNASQYPRNACYKESQANSNLFYMREPALKNLIENLELNQSISNHLKELNKMNEQMVDEDEFPSGVFDMTPCNKGAPIFLSYPHFLEADPFFLQQVGGLKPNFTKHRTYLDIEPQTGTPVDFIVRIQANVNLQTKNTKAPQMRSVILPVFWQEFSIHITPEIAQKIRQQTQSLTIATYSVSILALIIGLLMLIYAIFLIVIHFRHSRNVNNDDQDPLINDSSTETAAPVIE